MKILVIFMLVTLKKKYYNEVKKLNKVQKPNEYIESNNVVNNTLDINSDAYGVENAADMICNIVKNVNENVNCN